MTCIPLTVSQHNTGGRHGASRPTAWLKGASSGRLDPQAYARFPDSVPCRDGPMTTNRQGVRVYPQAPTSSRTMEFLASREKVKKKKIRVRNRSRDKRWMGSMGSMGWSSLAACESLDNDHERFTKVEVHSTRLRKMIPFA